MRARKDVAGIQAWNPLFCSPSPRDIAEVTRAHQKIPFDRLYAKYFVEREAYWHLRNFFLKHDEYTHLVIIPDDLIVEPHHVAQLYKDLEECDYAVLSGICNIDLAHPHLYSITENLPHPVRPLKKIDCPTETPQRRWYGWRWYSWFTDKTIQDEQKRQNSIIIRVQHSGFALQAIRRDVVEQIEFMTDALENGIKESETSSVDVMFSNSCGAAGIPIFVDPRIKMLHLREAGPVEIILGDSELWHIKNGDKYVYKTQGPVPKRTKAYFEPQTET